MRAVALDHVVLVVADVERCISWYQQKLNLQVERLQQWRSGEALFPSLRIDDCTLIDVVAGNRSGQNVDHLAIVVSDVDLRELADSGTFDVVAGPTEVWGARGMGHGLYVRDPDGNTIELRTYP